jgi:hypothetical protein
MTEEKTTTTETPESAIPAAGAVETDTLNKLRTENEQLKASIRLAEAHRQITAELAKAGARSPELLFASIRDHLQFADDGTMVNAAALIARLTTDFPEQFGKEKGASIDGGSGRTAPPAWSKKALARMSPAEIAKLDWDDVRRTLAEAE